MATIQIKDVPEEVAETFRRRAAAAGQSLQSYMRQYLITEAGRRTKSEIMQAIRDTLERHPTPGSTTEQTIADLRELRGE
ncbi:putative antitoxin VapB1 [Longimycelium tulufanense]|uniref:Putative antitoxin VapB1 n=1 Tax=Longimycelium tulufanense TaxID=907463 RepID=A0A8J3C6U4_9PSEU|nr:antitoxin [Longimycelium tulufanense]GGM43923.1 putative antitoxin VapB1 [Longimycelium tulufanense]